MAAMAAKAPSVSRATDPPGLMWQAWEPRIPITAPGLCGMCGGAGQRRYGLAKTRCGVCHADLIVTDWLSRVERPYYCHHWWDAIEYRQEWFTCDHCGGTGRDTA